MISIENFYFVLYANLLRPAGLDCFYYYPFGTVNNLSMAEFGPQSARLQHHALFHYDQEPLYDDESLGMWYDIDHSANCHKIIKLLANSEHSQIKHSICQKRTMMDWYFFYHGFAAGNWFRDTRYLPNLYEPRKPFSSFNHLVSNKRSYRMALTARLHQEDLLVKGDVSFHATKTDCEREINDPYSELSLHSKKIVADNLINDICLLPIIRDDSQIDATYSAKFGHQEYRLWQNSFLHVVNETVFYQDKLHLTEKVFKPIVSLRPFVLVAAPGNLAYIKSYGFKTFDCWIDETYDTILDHDTRLDAITQEVKRLCQLSPSALADMHQDMMSVLQFNKEHFFTTFREIIVDELVDNFDTCIRRWNNGLLDENRVRPRNYCTQQIKQLLKQ